MSTEPRPRRAGRLILALAAGSVMLGSGFVTWCLTTLTGLPDVGDPFDVQAFARPIPDDTNAFVFYKKAAALLPKVEPKDNAGDWSNASQEEREWLDQCREALKLWRVGSARPDALNLDPSTSTFDTLLNNSMALRTFARAAFLQASRLQASGDFEGAFDWYHAVLRSSRHCGRRGGFIERLTGLSLHKQVCVRLSRWSTEPRIDARLLRKALDAAIEADEATRPASDIFKAEYLIFLHSIADPELMIKLHDYEIVPNGSGGSTTLYGQHPWKSSLTRLQRRAMNEPERSRRVVRLIFANWLAYGDLPPSRRPPMVDPAWLPASATKETSPAEMMLGNLVVVGDDAPGLDQGSYPRENRELVCLDGRREYGGIAKPDQRRSVSRSGASDPGSLAHRLRQRALPARARRVSRDGRETRRAVPQGASRRLQAQQINRPTRGPRP